MTTRGPKDKLVIVGKGNPVKKQHYGNQNQAEALAAAKDEYDKRLRNMRQITLELPGQPDVSAESQIEVSDSRATLNHEWVVTKVTHTFGGEGYKTAFGATTLAALQIVAMKEQGEMATRPSTRQTRRRRTTSLTATTS